MVRFMSCISEASTCRPGCRRGSSSGGTMNNIARFALVTLSCLLIAAGPAPSDPNLERGNALIGKDEFVAAEKVFREALITDPKNVVYRSQLALCLIKQKKYEDDERELDQVLQQHPNDTAALWYRTQSSFDAGKYR